MKQLVVRKHWALVYDNEKLIAEYYRDGNLYMTFPINLATDAVEQLDLYEAPSNKEPDLSNEGPVNIDDLIGQSDRIVFQETIK